MPTAPDSNICPICNEPLFGSGKTLTSMEDERIVHLGCYISEPCDCPHEKDGCHFSGYCEYRKAPDKDLNGTWLPTCGFKFPDKKNVGATKLPQRVVDMLDKAGESAHEILVEQMKTNPDAIDAFYGD